MTLRSVLLAVLASTSFALAVPADAQELGELKDCTVGDAASLEGRNCAFLRTVRKNGDRVEPFLPRTGLFTHVTTTHNEDGLVLGTWRFPAEALSKIQWGHPLFVVFDIDFEGQPIATLSQQVRFRGTMWRRVGRTLRFVPADSPDDSPLWVEWRREGDRWVVSAVGDEEYGAGVPLPSWCC